MRQGNAVTAPTAGAGRGPTVGTERAMDPGGDGCGAGVLAASREGFRLDTIHDEADFERLREEWNELLEDSASDCLFLTWEWLHTWWKHLRGSRKLHIITLRRGGRLIAVAPLAVRPPAAKRLLPFRVVEFLGTGQVGSDYLDVIVRREAEEEALAALGDRLGEEKLMFELAQVRKDSSLVAALAARLGRHGWTSAAQRTEVCPYIPLAGHSWDTYLSGLGADHRYNFRRRLKNLGKQFDVRFEPVASESRRREVLGTLVELHNRRWEERGGSTAFHTAGLLSFHEDLSRLAFERGWLRLFALRLNGNTAASLYGFRYGRTFYFYQSGFDSAYLKHSIGLVTMGLAIKSAIEEGAGEYDLLHGDEAYKSHWAGTARDLERLELYPPGGRGVYYRSTVSLTRAVRRNARRLLGGSLADRLAADGRRAGRRKANAAQTR